MDEIQMNPSLEKLPAHTSSIWLTSAAGTPTQSLSTAGVLFPEYTCSEQTMKWINQPARKEAGGREERGADGEKASRVDGMRKYRAIDHSSWEEARWKNQVAKKEEEGGGRWWKWRRQILTRTDHLQYSEQARWEKLLLIFFKKDTETRSRWH